MLVNSLSLNNIVNIAVVISPAAVPGPNFNQALIVGPSTHIPSATRLKLYSSLSDMLADHFITTDPEYLAAEVYFGQTPAPSWLWVGRQDLSAISTIAKGAPGSGYAVGDVSSVTQSGGSGGHVVVTALLQPVVTTGSTTEDSEAVTVASGAGIANGYAVTGIGIDSGTTVSNITGTAVTLSKNATADGAGVTLTFTPPAGAVDTISPVIGDQGTGYTAANGLATTNVTGTGTGLTVNITAIGETPVAAIAACRLAQPNWYACMFVGTATAQQHKDVAAFIEGASPAAVYFLTWGDPSVLATPTSNLLSDLQNLGYRRTWGQYATTQGGLYPNNAYASAAPMGYAMASNTGAAGSYFDVMFKHLSGVAPEPLTQSEANTICGPVNRSTPGLNANVMLNYANGSYTWVQLAIMASGDFFDEVLNLDMLASDMQYSGVNLLTSVPALPITDGGVTMMRNVLMGACERAKARGFIAPSGVWQGQTVGKIAAGDPLVNGYFVYAPSVASRPRAERAARILPPMTVMVVESQSGHSLSVTLNVQR